MVEFDRPSKRSTNNKEPIDLVLAGSGTLAPCWIGGVARLEEEFDVVRVAGTSGGSIVAAGIASGKTIEEMLSLAETILTGEVLDPTLFFWDGYGLNKGNRMHALLEAYLPARLDDMLIPWGCYAVDVETGEPVFMNSWDDGHLGAADCVAASSSIPFFFAKRSIRGLPGESYVDGGISVNFAMSTWDDVPARRTIGLKFVSNIRRKPVRSLKDYVLRILNIMFENAGRSYVSKKYYSNVISIVTRGSSMDYALSKADIKQLYDEGYASVDKYLYYQKLARVQ